MRHWRRSVAGLLLLLSLGGCMPAARSGEAAVRADHSSGELGARPVATAGAAKSGIQQMDGGLLYVPKGVSGDRPAPLVVMLHGAGGTAQHSIDLARAHADRLGFILFAPGSRAATWDIIASRSYGTDVQAIDAALKQIFSDYAVNPELIAVAGFSDGASYALSLGLTNGDLFSHVLAFSPGFMAPGKIEGEPHIFISHGVQDRVLPIDVCSRRIVPQLKRAGYDVDYREFPDGHVVPPELARSAFDRLAPKG